MKIDGMVVLYNPDNTTELIDNINSYIKYVDRLYIVDNSDVKNENLIKNVLSISDKCVYVNNNGNQGKLQMH
jgi:rhamnosyltransferase